MPSLETIIAAAVKSGTFASEFGLLANNNSTSSYNVTTRSGRVGLSNMTSAADVGSDVRCENCRLPKLVKLSIFVFVLVNCISGSIVTLRLTTRWRRLKTLSIEDYLISIAWLLGLTAGVVSHYRDLGGFGAPSPSPGELSAIYHQQFIFMQLFYLTLATIQASVALNYKSFSGGLKLWHDRFCNAVLVYIVLGSLLESFTYFFQCRPYYAFWEFEKREYAQCYLPHLTNILLVYGPPIFRIIGDVSLILIPLPIVFSLKLPKSQKFAVVGVICITFLSIAANIQRLRLTTPTASSSIPQFLGVILPQIQMWSNIEIGSGIICACAVTLRGPVIEFWNSLVTRMSPRHKRGSVTSEGERSRMGSLGTVDSTVLDRSGSVDIDNLEKGQRPIIVPIDMNHAK